MKNEIRSVTVPLELRQVAQGLPHITGYAAVFDQPALIRDFFGQFEEVVRKGAFKDALAGDVRALFDHQSWALLGRTTNGTLSLREDDKGLFMDIEPGDTQAGRDAVAMIKRGDVKGASFQFQVMNPDKDQRWTPRESGMDLRELLKLHLVEVSPTAFPAYEGTEVGVRSQQQPGKELRPWRDPALQMCRDGMARDRDLELWQSFILPKRLTP